MESHSEKSSSNLFARITGRLNKRRARRRAGVQLPQQASALASEALAKPLPAQATEPREALPAQAAALPTVTTDKADYAPGAPVIITATGIAAGSTVRFDLKDSPADPGADGNADDYGSFFVTDGAAGDLDGERNGQVMASWMTPIDNNGSGGGTPDALDATVVLTAQQVEAGADGIFGTADDEAKGRLMRTTFTDGGLILTKGASVTVDESGGLQNSAAIPTPPVGDADDNDISGFLPTIFSDRLGILGLNAGTPIEKALSGYTGAFGNSGSALLTVSGALSAVDLAFVDSAGKALNGLDSGLKTLDGGPIYLYTDTNNNILLGRKGSISGAIVFALYLEEIGTPVTGAKVWTALYQAIKHPDITNPDDSVDLTNKVYVGASQNLEFNLAGAPSGQNLFLMFTTANPTINSSGRVDGPAIIATGKDPANQSTGASITTGDTINTSQAGGPTTFGTNNQMIVEQEGIRFTFVAGAKADVTIPNLDQNEADVEGNIDFTSFYAARSATFTVVQLQSGKTAQVQISAINNVANAGNGIGVSYIDDYADDSGQLVFITGVKVYAAGAATALLTANTTSSNSGIVAVFNADGTVLLKGITAGQRIEYTTSGDHNRVLVQNGAAINASGQDHADFDIGGFSLLQVSSSVMEVGSFIRFEDDGPTLNANAASPPPELSVDESSLGTSSSANYSSCFPDSGVPGVDGQGPTAFSAYSLDVSSPGVDSGLIDVATGFHVYLYQESGQIVGRVGSAETTPSDTGFISFRVTVNSADGAVTLLQQRALRHSNPTNPNDRVSPASANLINLYRTTTYTDAEGDSVSKIDAVPIAGALVFLDDGPSISLTGTEPTLTVDETVLTTNDTKSFAANFTSAFGADGQGTLSYALGVGGAASGLIDTVTAEAVNLSLNGLVVEGRTALTNALVFTVSVDGNGNVTLDQIRAVMHPVTTDPNDSKTLSADNLVTLTATKTDKDGDSATATLNIGQNLVFLDDGPSISLTGTEPTLTVDETVLTTNDTKSFAANFTSAFGADGQGTLSYALGVGGAASGLIDTVTAEAVNLSLNGLVVEGRTATTNALVFTVSVDGNGNVTLDQIRAVMHPVTTDPNDSKTLSADNLVTLTATKTDKDGDSATAMLNIGQNLVFLDDGPSISLTGTEPTLTVDETVLTTNDTKSFAANFTSAFGADGQGTLSYALGVGGAASGLIDTVTAEAVNLSLNGLVVEGRTATTNALVFTVSVDGNGNVTLDQIRAVMHPVTTDPNDSKTLSADNLVTLTATKTDKDGDSATATLSIGQNLVFLDDGPSISLTGTEPTLTVDETVLTTNDTKSFAANFTSAFGADGQGTLSYALGVGGAASGLIDTVTAEAVNLSLNGLVVEGRTALTNALVFTVSVDGNGNVTLDQIRAVMHPVTTDPNDSKTLSADNLVTLTATKTDKDGDSATATLNIGQNLVFLDDGPSIKSVLTGDSTPDTITFKSAIGPSGPISGNYVAWNPGADGYGSVVLSGLVAKGAKPDANGEYSLSPISPSGTSSISFDVLYDKDGAGGEVAQKIATYTFDASDASGLDSFRTYDYTGSVSTTPTLVESGASVKPGGPHPVEFKTFADPKLDLAILVTGGTRAGSWSTSTTGSPTPGLLNTSANGYAAGDNDQNLEYVDNATKGVAATNDVSEIIVFDFTNFDTNVQYANIANDAASSYGSGSSPSPSYKAPVVGLAGNPASGDLVYKAVDGFGFDFTKLTGGEKAGDFVIHATYLDSLGAKVNIDYQFTGVSDLTTGNGLNYSKVFVGYCAEKKEWNAYSWNDSNLDAVINGGEVYNGDVKPVKGNIGTNPITGLISVSVENNEPGAVIGAEGFNVANPRFYAAGTSTETVPEFSYDFLLTVKDADQDLSSMTVSTLIAGTSTSPTYLTQAFA